MTLIQRIKPISPEGRARVVAALVTLLLCVGVAVMVAYLKLSYIPSAQQQWPPADSSELLFEGEYVMTGDVAEPEIESNEPAEAAAVEEPATDGTDITDAGPEAPAPTPPVTSERTSPMKVKPPVKEEKAGPAKPQTDASTAKEKARQETRQKIAGQVKFGSNTSSDKGSGKSGAADGNAAAGALSGAPGYNLTGRTLAHWELPTRTAPDGTVTVRVVVNQQGQVIEASVSRSSGAAAANEAVRSACVAAARKSKFSVKLDAPARQSGTITYKFVSK